MSNDDEKILGSGFMSLTRCGLVGALLLLLLVGCPVSGGGGDDDDAADDDDATAADDDDATAADDDDTTATDDDDTSGQSMVLTMTISNQTGYGWNGYGYRTSESPLTVAPAVESIDGIFATGTTVVGSQTYENVEYGEQFCLAFRARDEDEDCYDWDNHGNCYNTGAQVAVEIIVDFSMWEQGGCPAW